MGAGRQRTTPPTPLAAAIRQTRLNLGLSQELFAIRVGVTTNTVKRWERGKVPDPANEGRLLELGVPADEFAAGDPTTQVPTEPVSLMQEALSNQREIRQVLERVVASQETTVEILRSQEQEIAEMRTILEAQLIPATQRRNAR